MAAASSEGRRGRPLIFGSKSPLERATLALEVHRGGEAEVRCALEHTGKAARFDSRRQAARCGFSFSRGPYFFWPRAVPAVWRKQRVVLLRDQICLRRRAYRGLRREETFSGAPACSLG